MAENMTNLVRVRSISGGVILLVEYLSRKSQRRLYQTRLVTTSSCMNDSSPYIQGLPCAPNFLDDISKIKENNIEVELLKKLIVEQLAMYR